MAYPERNQVVLVKKRADPDVAETLDLTNAVYVETPDVAYNVDQFDLNEVGGTLDDGPSLPGGGTQGFTVGVNLKGSLIPATKPDWTPLAEACGLAADTLAADLAGTSTAVGASTITLAVAASASLDAYKGQVIVVSGQTRIIVGYSTGRVATVDRPWSPPLSGTPAYVIPAGTRFRPTSAALPLLDIWRYQNQDNGGLSKLEKCNQSAGNVAFTFTPGRPISARFTFTGALLEDADVSAPGIPTFLNKIPPVWMNAPTYLGANQIALRSLTYDLGNRITVLPDPNAVYSRGRAGITGRRQGGNLSAPMSLKSVRDGFQSWLNSTEYGLSTILPGAVGNRIAVGVERKILVGVAREIADGFRYDSHPFRTNVADGGISFYIY